MNQLETTKTISKEERKQLISLFEKYSKEEIETALHQLNEQDSGYVSVEIKSLHL